MKLNSAIRSRGCFLQTYLVEHKERSTRDSLRRRFLRVWGRNWPCKPAERIWHPVTAMLAVGDQHMPSPVWWRHPSGENSAGVRGADRRGLTPSRFTLPPFSHTDKSYFVRLFHYCATVWWRYLEYKHTQPVGTQSQNSQWKIEKFSQMIFPASYEVTGSIHLTEFG